MGTLLDPFADDSRPVPIKRKKRERTVERAGDRMAKRAGYEPLKMKVVGKDGFPDKWYVRADHTLIWEWKKPGEEPKGHQIERMKWLAKMGYDVGWSDNINDFFARLK